MYSKLATIKPVLKSTNKEPQLLKYVLYIICSIMLIDGKVNTEYWLRKEFYIWYPKLNDNLSILWLLPNSQYKVIVFSTKEIEDLDRASNMNTLNFTNEQMEDQRGKVIFPKFK